MSKEQLLEYVRKTNPGMTSDKLMEELSKCDYSSLALYMTAQNYREKER